MKKKLSIIVPVYNEQATILEALRRVIAVDIPFDKEIIIINDASTDKTKSLVENFIKGKRDLILLSHPVNLGKGASVKDGILRSSGDYVIIQDADLEYNPQDYKIMLLPFLTENVDVVYGSRFLTDRPRRVFYYWHSVGNQLVTLISNMLTNLNLTDMETGYKAFKGQLIRDIAKKLSAKRFGFEPEVTARIAKVKDIKIYEVGVSYAGRTYAEGKKLNWTDGLRALWEMVKYNLLSS